MSDYYESASVIQEKLLGYMNDDYCKEKGYWLWEILKAVACELSDITENIDEVKSKLFVENLQGDELDDYVNNWSYITRKNMVQASGEVTFMAKNDMTGVVTEGTYVSNGKVNYMTTEGGMITEKGGSVTLQVVCCEFGIVGNTDSETIKNIVTENDWLLGCVNLKAITGGEDEESDENLKERYLNAVRKMANAGNIEFYRELAESVDGVGSACCIPCPDGKAGHVDIYLTNGESYSVSDVVVKNVQNLIDPNKNGDGSGEAPIGAIVTVKNTQKFDVNVNAEILLESGYSIDTVKENATEKINNYIKSCYDEGIVRINQVGRNLLETEGIKDYRNLMLDGEKVDISQDKGHYCFCLGFLELSEM